ncbi:MAG: hypothetical protein KAW67_01350, partial [Candidatus Eisenbacteria sp.]|nr:hypothetical protein [Candidatus Eisenbacteria bacterium]
AATLDLALSGFAFGLALGVKYSIFAFVLLSIPIAFLVQVWVGRAVGGLSLPQAGRFASRRILSFVGAMAIPSIFWFVQNWIVAGSPLAPLSTEMVARAFLRHDATYVSSTAAWWWFPWLDRATVGSYDATVGFGAAFAALGLPSTGLSVWMFLRARRGSGARIGIAVVLALIVVGAVTWWFGGHHMPRFLFPAVALACAPVALLFDRVVRHVRPALVGVLVLATFFSMSEVLRIVYRADDLRSSIKPFVTSAEHYQMPELVYELPPRTRILLIDPRLPGVDHFRTFKYPLAGHLPGNEVVMMGDVGTETDLVRDGLVLGHPSLIRDGIDYIFVRTLALPPGSTVFDNYPSLYTKVIDTVEEPYPWYREGFLPTPGEEFDLRAPVVTKMYKVLRRQ